MMSKLKGLLTMDPMELLRFALGAKPKRGKIPETEYVAFISDKLVQDEKGTPVPGHWFILCIKLPEPKFPKEAEKP